MHDGSRSSSLGSAVGVANSDIRDAIPEAAVAVSPNKAARKARHQYSTATKDQSIAGNLKSKMLRAKPLPSSLSSGRQHASGMHERRNSEPGHYGENRPMAMRRSNLAGHGEPTHGSALQSVSQFSTIFEEKSKSQYPAAAVDNAAEHG
jgi:hypothetical protein